MNVSETTISRRLEAVRLILKDLLKVIKVVSMYPENNPLPQSMRRSFSERLEEIVADYGKIELTIEKTRLLSNEDEVYLDRSKEDALAGLFFGAGLTTLAFTVGLDVDEIQRLLDVLKVYVNAPKDSDLATGLWQAGLPHVVVTTVEDVALAEFDGDFVVQEFMDEDTGRYQRKGADAALIEGYKSIFALDEPDGGGDGADDSGGMRLFEAGDEVDLKTAEASEAMGLNSLTQRAPRPEMALIINDETKLSEEELVLVREQLADDASFDAFESTAELVKEMLHQENELNDFFETVSIAEKVISEFLGHARLMAAGLLVGYLAQLEKKLHGDRPRWAERLKDARIAIGSRDRLKVLKDTLNADSRLGADELRRYLDNFGWEALSGITDLLGELEHRVHRETLCDYLASRGRDNIQIVSRGIYDKRWYVVRNSIVILARIGNDIAISHLAKVVGHEEKRVRLQLVQSLQESPADEALEILKTAVRDVDYEIRREAVNSIVARRGQPAFDAITELINDDQFIKLDFEEQKQLLRAYSILGGQYALEFLQKLITQPNLLRSHTLTRLRDAALEALAHNRSEKAERLLVKLSNSWRPQLKQLAQATINRRREILYGGNDDDAGQ